LSKLFPKLHAKEGLQCPVCGSDKGFTKSVGKYTKWLYDIGQSKEKPYEYYKCKNCGDTSSLHNGKLIPINDNASIRKMGKKGEQYAGGQPVTGSALKRQLQIQIEALKLIENPNAKTKARISGMQKELANIKEQCRKN